MLDLASHIFVTQRDHEATPVLGSLPSLERRQQLGDLFQPKALARKAGAGMVVSVPLDRERWCIWLLPTVPKVVDLPQLLSRAQEISRGFVALAPTRAKEKDSPLPALARRVQPLPKRRRQGAMASLLVEHAVERGLGRSAVLFLCDQGVVRNLWMSDSAAVPDRGALERLVAARLSEAASSQLVSAASEAAEDFDAGLIIRRAGARAMRLELPGRDQRAYGLALFDPSEDAAAGRDLVAMMQLAAPLAPPRKKGLSLYRALTYAALAAVAVALVWPVPLKFTVTGTAIPAQTQIVSLPSDAVLEEMLVKVGDLVEKGQPIARFQSTQLAEQEAQHLLEISVEELNAQAARAKNDYGAFQIAEARRDIAMTRLKQVQARMAALSLVAPAAGRIVTALPDTVTGSSMGQGRDVAQIQVGPNFHMTLQPSRVDARLIATGITGRAYFKGLREQDYGVTLLTPAALVTSPDGATETLQATAELTGDSDRLIAGLTGYARLEGPVEPRLFGMGRYVIEYLRVKSWTFLGLRW